MFLKGLRPLGLFSLLLFLGLPLQAHEPRAELDSAGWVYKLMKSSFQPIDEALQEAGIPVAFCTYIYPEAKIHFLARETSACLYKNLREGLSQKGPVGTVEVWVRTNSGQVLPLLIQWRPTEHGYWGVIREFLAWKFETLPHWWSETFADDPQAEKEWKFSQSLLGSLSLRLPVPYEEVFKKTSFAQINQARSLHFSMQPLFKKNGYLNYEITMNAQIENQDSLQMNFKTNVNVIRLERSFFLRGRLAQEGQDL